MKKLKKYKTVLELLKDPNRWTQRGSARTSKHGNFVSANNPKATSFCLVGAIQKIYGNKYYTIYGKIYEVMHKYYNFHSLVKFNDDPKTKHSDILKVLQKAKV